MKSTVTNRFFAAITISLVVLLGGFAVGCGSNDSESSSETTAQSSESLPKDEAQIRALVARAAKYAGNRNAQKFCTLFVKKQFDDFAGKGQCVPIFRQAMKSGSTPSQFVIESVELDGDKATVSFSGEKGIAGVGDTEFVKVDGQWYLAVPESSDQDS